MSYGNYVTIDFKTIKYNIRIIQQKECWWNNTISF